MSGHPQGLLSDVRLGILGISRWPHGFPTTLTSLLYYVQSPYLVPTVQPKYYLYQRKHGTCAYIKGRISAVRRSEAAEGPTYAVSSSRGCAVACRILRQRLRG